MTASQREVVSETAADQRDAALVASLFGHRDDFVIDLRVEGRTESYLRQSADAPLSGSRSLRFVRRSLDIVTAFAGLAITFPIFAIVAIATKVRSDGPVFFAQERVGRSGRIFRCYKFRTMHVDAADRLDDLLAANHEFRAEWELDQKVANDPRVTPIGRLLRKTSLDELPQLINVIKGDMSIVGPRPVIPQETVRYGSAMPIVLSVRPGITGLWQVSGRNNLPYPERVALDLRYVDEQSIGLDLSIIGRTFVSVATGHGAS